MPSQKLKNENLKLRNRFLNSQLSTLNSNGATLIELVMVLVIVGFIVLLLSNLPASIGLIGKSRFQSTAREIVIKQIEDKRAIQYANLANGTEAISDPRLSILPSGQGTILTEDCNESVCSGDEELSIKQLTVTINWKEGSEQKKIVLKTLIGEGGLNQ